MVRYIAADIHYTQYAVPDQAYNKSFVIFPQSLLNIYFKTYLLYIHSPHLALL